MKSVNEALEIPRAIAQTAFGATIQYREVAQKCQQNFQEKCNASVTSGQGYPPALEKIFIF